MTKKQRDLLITAGIFAGAATAAAAATYITTKLFVDAAIAREKPELMQAAERQLSGSQWGKDFLDLREEDSQRLLDTPMQVIEITSDDGITLVGHYYPAENAKRIILAMHGWRSTWADDFGMVADFWHSNGCSVLFAEQRGQNDSGGEYISFGLLERHDCRNWIDYIIESNPEPLPIYLAGISMGAATVLMAAGEALPERVHGIMADCGFTSPHEIWKHVANKNLKLPYGIHGIIADEMFRRKLNMGTNDYSTVTALENNTVPVLFVHGSDDRFVPVDMTYKNYVACTAQKRLLIVPGADHGMSYFNEKEKYEATVKEFWKDFD